MTRPLALVLTAPGTNRDAEAVDALDLAGAEPMVVPITQLREHPELLAGSQLLMLAGGFSYGDALGAGRLLALDLNVFLADQLAAFVAEGKPVLGVCNGFQALVRAGGLRSVRTATGASSAAGSRSWPPRPAASGRPGSARRSSARSPMARGASWPTTTR
jgi:phosphoribosylformylglycinamidine (FGAM) synthase-like amidotransferase family enzyme